MIADVGLRRFAEADLVRHDHAIALAGQRRDRVRPVIAGKTFAVQQHHGFVVRRRGRRHIHVGHAQRLAFDGEIQMVHWVGIIDALEADAEWLQGGRWSGRCLRHGAAAQRDGRKEDSAIQSETISHGGLPHSKVILPTDVTMTMVLRSFSRPSEPVSDIRKVRRARTTWSNHAFRLAGIEKFHSGASMTSRSVASSSAISCSEPARARTWFASRLSASARTGLYSQDLHDTLHMRVAG